MVSTSLGWSPHVQRQATRWNAASNQATKLWDAPASHNLPPSHDSETEDLSSILNRLRQKHGDLVAEPTDFQYAILKEENAILREINRQLEIDNERLRNRAGKIVIENFEGEGRIASDWFGADTTANKLDEPDGVTMTAEQMEQLWCDELDADGDMTCPLEPTISFGEALRDRALWLVGLLALQSCSGFILSRNEVLLANHPVIIYFLTMLVGAGGNAGNQASVRGKSCSCIALISPIQTCVSLTVLAVIRGLALGTLNERTQGQFLSRELKMAGALSAILSLAGFTRAAVFRTPFAETIAVTSALMLIVFSSICLGAVLPLLLKKLGVDPAHSSTTIQVRHAMPCILFTHGHLTMCLRPIAGCYGHLRSCLNGFR
jgi:hypothetical protein